VLVAVCCAWALVLVVGGVWYARHGRPTVREQTTAAGAGPTVDRAIGQVINAAGTGVVPAVTGYDEVTTCAITPVRQGVRYDREAWLATAPGTESALLDRIVAGLPRSYRASAAHPKTGGLTAQRMSADAGDYVQITGSVDRAGLVRVTAGTGCRPRGDLPAPDPTRVPAATDRAPVQRILDALGVEAPHWSSHRLPCGVRTVEAVGAARQTLDALPVPAHPPVVDRDDVYAERSGLLARTDGDQLTVTLTTGACRS
jgi:hypothetical protein